MLPGPRPLPGQSEGLPLKIWTSKLQASGFFTESFNIVKNRIASFNQFMKSLEIVFSSSPSTKSHCDCDERFFNCLRWATIFDQTESSQHILLSFLESDHDLILREVQSNKADAVGKLFFNFLKIQVNLINPKQ